ncbi:MAG: rhodanese-like domain-containing protein [Planctomycetes bacterium]|nr:rhodanese-like domain-containing protein [Planctomycetota bacterium]
MTTNKKPAEAKALIDNEGWLYLDVRSVEEFQAGHPAGAWNIPVMHKSPMGMTPNATFAADVARAFKKDTKLIVGCASGVRSLRACDLLAEAGFEYLANMEGGFMGARDDYGRVTPGWASSGFPVEAKAPDERTYAQLKAKPQ